MKLRTYLAAALVAATTLTLAPNAATASGSDGDGGQYCSIKFNGNLNVNTILCVVPTVTLGDISLQIVDDADVLTGDQLNLTVHHLIHNVDVLGIRDFQVLTDNTLVYINGALLENVLNVCTGKRSPNMCRSQSNRH